MVFRIRLAVVLLSFAVVGLELALMRVLSLRFWYYFAAMVISVALLGFGCSGTLLTLAQRRLNRRRGFWLPALAYAAALSMLLCAWGVQHVPLDIHYLAWDLGAQWLNILAVELLMLLPFLLAGGFVGLVLMDRADRIAGHYAANLVGSGAGALLSVILMSYVSIPGLLVVLALLGCGAGAALTHWKSPKAAPAGALCCVLWLAAAGFFPSEIRISPYKKLALEKSKPRTQVMRAADGPLGRIDIVRGPAIHDAPPGMSLQNPYPIPDRTLVIVDGDQTRIVYNAADRQDWRFLDYTTAAAAWTLNDPARVLVIGPGGGAPLGLAYLKAGRQIDALAGNRQMTELIRSRLADVGGRIYHISRARTYFEAPRGWLRRTGRSYDLILLPLLDSAGPGAGLQAAQENYLYTVQSLQSFIRHLTPDGMLSVTVRAKTPPRDGLRIFNTAVAALQQEGLPAPDRLALIRSWETVTLAVRKTPWTDSQLQRLRAFSRSRGFDLAYLPGLEPEAANRFHVLARPYYYEGARALLGADRQDYIRQYPFALEAPTDDRPYFNHFIRWRQLPELRRQLQGRLPAFLELGSLLMTTALGQVAALAGVLIFLPLWPRRTALRATPGRGRVMLYFFLLGTGFMLLEMGFLQKLILYLAHPIYSAAAVIAAFLVFAGVGSRLSQRWVQRTSAAARAAAWGTAGLGCLYLLWLDPWLALTQSWAPAPRFAVAVLTIAPLALAMGHLFPLGLRRVSEAAAGLVPWSWAVNGFASVLATAGAPLLAMSVGFSKLILAALACYLAAGILFACLPRTAEALD